MMTKANQDSGLTVGDRFSTQGRGTTFWEIEAITDIRHVGQIITFAEIGGITRMKVHVNDISTKGFHRVARPK
jgi:hypothetical protein